MTDEQKIVIMEAQMLECRIRMQAMVEDNAARIARGRAPLYGKEEFLELIQEFGIGQNAVISYLTSN